MTTVPVARGLILCLSSHEDDFTGRVTLTDCFNELTARAFPAAGRTFWVAAFLSDGAGDLVSRVEIVHPDRGQTIYSHEQGIRIRGRLAVYTYRRQVSGCVFPEPGVYEVLLIVADEVVAATSFTVRLGEPDDE